MQTKELGTTGVQIPEIGLGTWQYRGGVEPLRRGIERGAFLIDTAEMYGTEGVVGEAIKGIRDKVFVATKVTGTHLRYDEVLRAAEGSLKRLGVERIDLYQIHWPDRSVPIAETMAAMEKLVDDGKVRYIGVSNFYLADLAQAERAMKKYRIVANQVKYSLLQRGIEKDLMAYCQKNGITIIAYSPLGKGELVSVPLLRRRNAMKVLQNVARETGKTMAQVALNWCIVKPNVVAIPKSDSVERTVENCGASGWRLSEAEMRALNEAFPSD
ncbi:MAG TPA: aldo/keto reductase [Candidatus Acidoferrales bacterium]|nr:aldo/keto reductase [Candidatus Acidoferrales bacterium]